MSARRRGSEKSARPTFYSESRSCGRRRRVNSARSMENHGRGSSYARKCDCSTPAQRIRLAKYHLLQQSQPLRLSGSGVLIKSSRTAAVVILLVAALSAAGAASLPDNPYQRFQFLPVLCQHLAWIYERVHYDPKPIDVAILGPSKTFTGVSGSEVEKRLSVLGKPANVANLSLVYQGRNAQWAILDELYKAKRPRILIVQIDEETAPWGHPWFMYFATSAAIAFPPSMLLHDYLPDVSFLPYRQMELFAASLFPNLFGFRYAFDPVHYATTRFDFTTSFVVYAAKWWTWSVKFPRRN